jgi:hypothetical protein
MNFVLDVCGGAQIHSPSDEKIRQAVLELDQYENDAFLILADASDDLTYLQCFGDLQSGFGVEYQEGDLQKHFRARGTLSAEQMIQALIHYRNGDPRWREAAEWEPLEL